MKKTALLATLLLTVLLFGSCGGPSIREQLYADNTVQQNSGTAPSLAPTTDSPLAVGSASSPLFGKPRPAKLGSVTDQGATVTAHNADGSVYYAGKADAMGRLTSEYAYSGYDHTLLFQTDYRYDTAGNLTEKTAVALADKAFGYTGSTDGVMTACRQIRTTYENGRESYVCYLDYSDRQAAVLQTSYNTDGSFVSRLYEYGICVYVRTYAADGSLLFTTEGNAVYAGMVINFGGSLQDGVVLQCGEDGSFTVRFRNQKHKMSDGTEYLALDLYVLFSAAYQPLVIAYQSGDTRLCEYTVTYAEDRSYTQTYHEFGAFVCTLHYSADDRLQQITAADGSSYDTNAVLSPAIGDRIGDGIICQLNEDGSFTVAYFNRPYTTLSGAVVEGTTLYSFFTADNVLLGNKYFYDGKGIAEYNLYYNTDGSYSVNIFENGSFMMTVEYDKDGNAVRATDADGNTVQ